MKRYKNGDRCPCCGSVIEGKSEAWLADFSRLVEDLSLREWPKMPELWDADAMLGAEGAPERRR